MLDDFVPLLKAFFSNYICSGLCVLKKRNSSIRVHLFTPIININSSIPIITIIITIIITNIINIIIIILLKYSYISFISIFNMIIHVNLTS